MESSSSAAEPKSAFQLLNEAFELLRSHIGDHIRRVLLFSAPLAVVAVLIYGTLAQQTGEHSPARLAVLALLLGVALVLRCFGMASALHHTAAVFENRASGLRATLSSLKGHLGPFLTGSTLHAILLTPAVFFVLSVAALAEGHEYGATLLLLMAIGGEAALVVVGARTFLVQLATQPHDGVIDLIKVCRSHTRPRVKTIVTLNLYTMLLFGAVLANLYLLIVGLVPTLAPLLNLKVDPLLTILEYHAGTAIAVLLAVSFLALEPVRQLSLSLFLLHLQVRSEARDLEFALQRVMGQRSSSKQQTHRAANAGVVLVAAVLLTTPTPEGAGVKDKVDRILSAGDFDRNVSEQVPPDLLEQRGEPRAGPMDATELKRLAHPLPDCPAKRKTSCDPDCNTPDCDAPHCLSQLPACGPLPLSAIMKGTLTVGITIFIILAAVFAYMGVRALMRNRRGRQQGGADRHVFEPDAQDGGAVVTSRSPAEWLTEADRLAAAGQFREALRCTYLSLLSRLHFGGVIVYERSKTNWSYVGSFPEGLVRERQLFSDLTNTFDYKWYGSVPTQQDDFAAFRDTALNLGRLCENTD